MMLDRPTVQTTSVRIQRAALDRIDASRRAGWPVQ
jgi:hypothetical protein